MSRAPKSMTGFGAARFEEDGLSIGVEIRTVNHRFLQIKSRLPQDFFSLEHRVDALVKERLARGSVTVKVNIDQGTARIGVNHELARQYAQELVTLARELGLKEDIDLGIISSHPGFLAIPPAGDPASVWNAIKLCLKEALDRLDEMRGVEGKAMLVDLNKQADKATSLLARIEELAPLMVEKSKADLTARIEELLQPDVTLPEDELAREFAILADRLDISEEVTRFRSHLDQWRSICSEGGQIGRRLEFLLQEMGREVNTMGSKANDTRVAHLVVEVKGILEKQREQIQNLE